MANEVLNDPPADSFVQLLVEQIQYGRFPLFVRQEEGGPPLALILGSGGLPTGNAPSQKLPSTSNPILHPGEVQFVRDLLPYLTSESKGLKEYWVVHLVSEIEIPFEEEEPVQRVELKKEAKGPSDLYFKPSIFF